MNLLTIYVNNQTVLEYDKESALADDKLAFLDSMDQGMSNGVRIQGKLINSPDSEQRARFVVMNLVKAMQQDNEAIVQVSCAYLVNRMPVLSEVHVNDADNGIQIRLVEETVN